MRTGPVSPRGVPSGWRTTALLATVTTAALAFQAPVVGTDPFFAGVNCAFVAVFFGLGHYLATQHGERFSGACLMVAAAGWLVATLDIYPRWGSVVSWLVGGALVYTPIGWGILRYGSSRLGTHGRAWVALCVAGTTGTCIPLMLVARPEWLGYPPGVAWFAPWPDRTAAMLLNVAACAGYLAIGGYFAYVALSRLRRAPPAQRRILRPLTYAGAAWAAAAAIVTTVGSLLPWALSIRANSTIDGVLSVSVGVALTAAINRSRLMAATFVEALPADHSPETLTEYARAALSDPTAELLFVVPGRTILIDGNGHLRELPDPAGDGRSVQWIVGSDDTPVAVLLGAPQLDDGSAVLRTFAKVMTLVAENQQLHAVLRMRLTQLTAARTAERLAFDRAREQFRRDLHDGVQTTVAAARMDLEGIADGLDDVAVAPRGDSMAVAALGASVSALDAKLTLALDQVRRLKQGGHPPELDFGLRSALDRTIAELRLDATRQVCDADLGVLTVPVYFLVREALTNAHKHARGAAVELVIEHRGEVIGIVVRDHGPGGAVVRTGGGLAGLVDRVTELGGTLSVDSPVGEGTTLGAVIPVVPA